MDNTPRFDRVVDLLRQPGAVDGETATEIVPLETATRRFTLMQKLRITTPSRQLHAYVKQYRLKQAGQDHLRLTRRRVERDYDTTRRLHERLSGAGLGVPRPLACFPDLLIVAFEESRGENLQALIARSARGWPLARTCRHLTGYAEQCGEWLGRFQRLTAVTARYSVEEMWQYVDLRLERLVADSRARFSEAMRQQARRYFERLAGRAGSLDLRMAAIHADFCPGNLLADTTGVTVIDWTMFAEGSVYQDLTHFHHQLGLLLLKPIFRPRVIGRIQEAFLQGYRRHSDIQRQMFEAFELVHITTHFLSLLDIRNPPLHERLYNRRLCRHHCEWIARRTAAFSSREAA